MRIIVAPTFIVDEPIDVEDFFNELEEIFEDPSMWRFEKPYELQGGNSLGNGLSQSKVLVFYVNKATIINPERVLSKDGYLFITVDNEK